MLSSRFAGIPISSSTIDGPRSAAVAEPRGANDQSRDRLRWPASFRNGGRHQIGTAADIKSESLAGLNRNSQDALYQHFLVTAEKRFWRCVETGEMPRPYGIEPPRPRIEAVRLVDMSESNSWAEFAGIFCATRSAFLDHERAKSELKGLMPEDAKEASGHGVRAKRSKSGSISFDLLAHGEGNNHATV
jgi:hypothetical protein